MPDINGKLLEDTQSVGVASLEWARKTYDRLDALLLLLDSKSLASGQNGDILLGVIDNQREIISECIVSFRNLGTEQADEVLESILALSEWTQLMEYEDTLDEELRVLAVAQGNNEAPVLDIDDALDTIEEMQESLDGE